jgi:hypothetical protein
MNDKPKKEYKKELENARKFLIDNLVIDNIEAGLTNFTIYDYLMQSWDKEKEKVTEPGYITITCKTKDATVGFNYNVGTFHFSWNDYKKWKKKKGIN